ncbi:phosphate ABC transporter substrate-binding/OmpA family protein [Oceanicella sp. SM1341]|uniref:phosphate ABC transporter substrate-binding/OmpA family protein n=1 Tax=Oceanicella sp. SM1341 TaxID=1548889 RepID=UPI000E4FFAC0|nr:phosphate ABC transporter substrate-binding/OmpA family protein [Oceanicella sp. SM1341]
MSARRGFFLAIGLAFGLAQGGGAQPDRTVVLRSADGAMSVTGELLGVEDGRYRLATAIGEIALDATRVRCEGAACPREVPAERTAPRLAVAPAAAEALLPALLEARAAPQVAGPTRETLPSSAALQALLDGDADLAVTDRALSPRELSALRDAPAAEGGLSGERAGGGLSGEGAEGGPRTQGAGGGAPSGTAGEPAQGASSRGGTPDTTGRGGAQAGGNSASAGSGDDRPAPAAGPGPGEGRASAAGPFGRAPGGAADDRGVPAPAVRTLALDALVPVTAPGGPVEAVSLGALAGVLAGEITDWAALGGPPAPIVPMMLSPETGAGARTEALLLAPAGRRPGPRVRMFDSAARLAEAVSATPGALAVIGRSHAGGLRQLGLEDACGRLEPPAPFTVKSGDYPFVVPLMLAAAPGRALVPGQGLGGFLLSPEAMPVIEAAGYVSLSAMRIGLGEQGVRLANTLLAPDEEGRVGEIRALLTELRDAERLSTTLRTDPATGRPDARSREEIRRLAGLLASGAFGGREVLFAGFTDSIGRADLNRDLSLRDAEDMRALVLGALPPGSVQDVRIATFGYGEISPVACNAHAAGRAVNRRVEVWLREPRARGAD